MFKIKKIVIASIAALSLLLSGILPATAQIPPGSGLSISPTLSEFTLKPGAADKLDINLKNITLNKITAQAAIYDFEADNVTGNPKIITDQSKVSPNSIRPFALGLENVTLDVGEQKKITLILQIPQDATPGAYFGIVRYKAVPAGATAPKEGEVSLSASVGSIVLVTVPGNIREQVQLTKLHIYRGGYDGSIFFGKPTDIGVELRNLGNGFIKPFGTVEVRNMFNKVVYGYQLNNTNPRSNMLPDSNRTFKDPVKNVKQVGRYTVTASVSYGNGSQVLTLKKTFWYIPWWLAAIIGAVLVILTLLVIRAYLRHRRDKRHSYRHLK